MLSLPRRCRAKRLGLTLRWAIACPTIADFDLMAHGSAWERWRLYHRLVRANPLSRLLCAREIGADFVAQVKACAFPKPKGEANGGDTPAGVDPVIARFAHEIARCTGIPPREQYLRFTPREWLGLMQHVTWVQQREDRFFAGMVGTVAIPDYPDMRDRAVAEDMDAERMREILEAWTSDTTH